MTCSHGHPSCGHLRLRRHANMSATTSCGSSDRLTDGPPTPKNTPIAEKGRQTLEIHHGGRQVDLDRDIRQAATHRPAQAVPCLRLAVNSLHTPAVTRVKGPIIRPAFDVPASGAQQRLIAVTDQDQSGRCRRAEAPSPKGRESGDTILNSDPEIGIWGHHTQFGPRNK